MAFKAIFSLVNAIVTIAFVISVDMNKVVSGKSIEQVIKGFTTSAKIYLVANLITMMLLLFIGSYFWWLVGLELMSSTELTKNMLDRKSSLSLEETQKMRMILS